MFHDVCPQHNLQQFIHLTFFMQISINFANDYQFVFIHLIYSNIFFFKKKKTSSIGFVCSQILCSQNKQSQNEGISSRDQDQMALSNFTKSSVKYISEWMSYDLSSIAQNLRQNPNQFTSKMPLTNFKYEVNKQKDCITLQFPHHQCLTMQYSQMITGSLTSFEFH